MPLADAAENEEPDRHLEVERVRQALLECQARDRISHALGEAQQAARVRHVTVRRRMDADRATELGRGAPERVVVGVVQLLGAPVRRGSEHDRLEVELLDAATHLGDGGVDVLERNHADAVEPARRRRAVVAQPVVVRATRGAEQLGIVDPGEHRGRVQHGDVDALGVHVDQPRRRVVAPGAAHLRPRLFVPGLAAHVGSPGVAFVQCGERGEGFRVGAHHAEHLHTATRVVELFAVRGLGVVLPDGSRLDDVPVRVDHLRSLLGHRHHHPVSRTLRTLGRRPGDVSRADRGTWRGCRR